MAVLQACPNHAVRVLSCPARRRASGLPIPRRTSRKFRTPGLPPSSPAVRFSFYGNPLRSAPPRTHSYPSPIPEFADAEVSKFKIELLEQLAHDGETFGDELDVVVEVCTEMMGEFLRKEYGGPGTLMVEPFTDMFVRLKENRLPGAPAAARTALLWAQSQVDRDWEAWNSR